ncbi:extracellular solute-binding protein [Synechococcus sp. RedBA-s]|uniref:extracellular solute-binding protein n=1 Tax=Synechococcus sp. RedBA-s TaxID=2823741 RepID=UPI0020CC3B2A|nr:extracellular solute-binding protein [Synechococcus sp. RedBA-s]MCP9799331.1 hypothetical protein [Synechococcus sp. RedBA-s]
MRRRSGRQSPRAPRILKLGCTLTLLLGLGGCSNGFLPDTLFIYVENESDLSRQAEIGDSHEAVLQLLKDFEQVNPGVRIQVQYFPSEAIVPATALRNARALGPDLLVTRLFTALQLHEQNLTAPVSFPGKRFDEIHNRFLSRFRLANNQFLAVPLLAEAQLACFNKRRVPVPPTSLDELIALSAKGMRVGLPLSAPDLYWTTSGSEAKGSLNALLESDNSNAAAPTRLDAVEQRQLRGWLNWLDDANQQLNVEFAEDVIELRDRLGKGERDWISCHSLWLGLLGRQLGSSLGVSQLPGRAGQPATTLTHLKVWSFGEHSSPRQRQLAKAFVLFTLNPVNQRRLMLDVPGSLPVNRQVLIPTKSSDRFAVMTASMDNSIMLNLRNPHVVEQQGDQLNDLLRQLILGTLDVDGVLQDLSAPGGAPPDPGTP